MFNSLKKIIKKDKGKNKENKKIKKPVLERERKTRKPREDYGMPGPEDIRRLPTPEPREKTRTSREFPKPTSQRRRERIEKFRRERRPERGRSGPMEPPPTKPLERERPRPSPKPSPPERNLNREILDKIENIEKRLERIENAVAPKRRTEERRY